MITRLEGSVHLEDIKVGSRLDGVIPAEMVNIIAVQMHGSDAVELAHKSGAGSLGQHVVFRKDERVLSVAYGGSRPFDVPAQDFELAAEAQRIKLAGLRKDNHAGLCIKKLIRARTSIGYMIVAPGGLVK